MRFLDICSDMARSDDSDVSGDVARPQITVSGLKDIVSLPNSYSSTLSLTVYIFQSLHDWVDALKKAYDLLQSSKRGHHAGDGFTSSTNLSVDQLKSRELYLYSVSKERTGDLSRICGNIGLACLAIRRLLKASFIFIFSSPASLVGFRVV